QPAPPGPSTPCAARGSGSRRSSVGRRRRQAGKPDLDERPHRLLEPRFDRDRKRLFPALPRLGRVYALLEAVVDGHEQLLDALAGVGFPLHNRSVTRQICTTGAIAVRLCPWPSASSSQTITASSPRRSRRSSQPTSGSRSSRTPATAARRSSLRARSSPTSC